MGSSRPPESLNVESTNEHTRILRVMLAVDDCIAYWKAPSDALAPAERARAAFDGHWFGTKSEARVKTLLGDMELRFERYPEALAALRAWKPPREVAPWICHFHTQLADPIYRLFTGDFLPQRRGQGYANIDREAAARWVQERWPGKWSASTCIKFGSNMLATAFEAGLLRDRKDPRKLVSPRVPKLALAYLLYLLRQVEIAGGILESAYLASVLPDAESRRGELRGLDGVRMSAIGDVQSFDWGYPDLKSWAVAQRDSGRLGLEGTTA
jgi:hypothetical protein